jgi:acetamidase/formamidase
MKLVLATIAVCAAAQAANFDLKATPSTVVWGNYWSESKPVLTIKSGDTVSVETVGTSAPQAFLRGGIKQEDLHKALVDIYANQPPREQRGPGGHILTGPIFVEGAEPGDVLEVRVLKTDLIVPYASNGFNPPRGVLPKEDFPNGGKSRVIPLDMKRMVAKFADNIEIPLHPFFGSMGLAPDPSKGKVNSGPPGDFAGNLDNKELVAGTSLYIPVFVKGALFEVGDGHAAMGNGEADITALETSLEGTFQFVVHKDMKLKWPRAQTPTHWIVMGLDPDLNIAMMNAVREGIDFLVTEKHMTREDAYMLCSVAVDFDVTQAVDGTKGIHGMIPKSLFK